MVGLSPGTAREPRHQTSVVKIGAKCFDVREMHNFDFLTTNVQDEYFQVQAGGSDTTLLWSKFMQNAVKLMTNAQFRKMTAEVQADTSAVKIVAKCF